ncbi:hypothetical protein [Rathayibacter sp. VKM Ac-2760]|uniref:hypothetical protein n=1 Tax=Rathayibacter sp. VKM Ac-2760 TaxID=2609253 RepID=UPI00131649B6|nr:hypothetical protein GSU72_09835 [Rathayibacter sp. VKM Ac-2760]
MVLVQVLQRPVDDRLFTVARRLGAEDRQERGDHRVSAAVGVREDLVREALHLGGVLAVDGAGARSQLS